MKHGKALLGIWAALSLGLSVATLAPDAGAVPGFFATSGGEAKSRSSQVLVARDGDTRVVSIMTDYEGPMDKFALVIPVPSDVSLADVRALKRGDMERLEELTAPRFHEFWEMDPCDEEKPQQIWEINRSASDSTDFLGGGEMFAGTTKAPPEMRIEVEPSFRSDSEYDFSLVGSNVASVLKSKGLSVPSGVQDKLDKYSQFIVAVVDARSVEIGAKGEAMLSPIRFVTQQDFTLATSLGAPHVKGMDELLVFTMDPKQQYQVKGRKNVYPPTDFHVSFEVKERTGDFYAALHDKMLEKDKDAFLVEFAWDTKGCGQPCPNAPLHLSEILTLGADVHERSVPEGNRRPTPPARSDEEQAAYDALKPDEKKKSDELAKEVARRKALIERRSSYVVTRLHHRFSTLEDIQLEPAPAMKGGIALPVGQKAELPQDVSPSDASQFQTRITTLHRSKVTATCPTPQPHRWGRPPKSFRGARKIWVADRLAWRDRGKVKLDEVIETPIPALGIAGREKVAADQAAVAQKAAEAAKESDCGCRIPGKDAETGAARQVAGSLGLLGLALALGFRRRRR
jgi:MYXO-CTERM domain-containing protein